MNLCPLALKQADTVPMIFPAFVLSRRPIPLYEASSDDKLSSLETLFPSIHLETMKLLCSIILQYYCNAYTVSSCCLLHTN